MKINWEKLNQDIEELEKKHKGEKKLRPVSDRYRQKFFACKPEPAKWTDLVETEEEKAALEVHWCKFCREQFLLTRLYSLKAHLRGRLHMTRVKYDWMYELSYAGLKSLYSKKTREMYQLVNKDKLILDWTMEDQAELVHELVELYSMPVPQLEEAIQQVYCTSVA